MRIHRIHTQAALEPESEIRLQGGEVHYLSRVLRLRPGQAIVLFNGDGFDYAAEIIQLGKHDVLIHVLSRLPARAESPFQITLAQAVSRGDHMDQSLQKSTELGVAAFQPLLTERVELRIKPDNLEKRMAHWRKVIISACEQSGRATVPPLARPEHLGEWLSKGTGEPRLLLEPDSESTLAQASLANGIELLVGPEGGFSESELALIRRLEVPAARLGPRILRTETAGPAAIAILQALAGDFG